MFWLNVFNQMDPGSELEQDYYFMIVIIGIVLIILTFLLCCLLLMLSSCYKIYLNRQHYEYSLNKILLSLQKTHKITAVIERNGSKLTYPDVSLPIKDLESLNSTATTSSISKSDQCSINVKDSLSLNDKKGSTKSKSPVRKKSAKYRKSLPIKISISTDKLNNVKKSNKTDYSQLLLNFDGKLFPSIVTKDQFPSISSTDPVTEMPLVKNKISERIINLNNHSLMPISKQKRLVKNDKHSLDKSPILHSNTNGSIKDRSLDGRLPAATPPTRYILTKNRITPLNTPRKHYYNTPPVYFGRKGVIKQNQSIKIKINDKIHGHKKVSPPKDDEPWFLMA